MVTVASPVMWMLPDMFSFSWLPILAFSLALSSTPISASSEPLPSMVTSPLETCRAEPFSEKILLSPFSVMFALELPTSMASPLLLMFTFSMVTSAVAPPVVSILIVLSVAVSLFFCLMTGASSASVVSPCDTV